MIRTKAELKSYFETGDFPTEENFSDLIDTLVTETDIESIKDGLKDKVDKVEGKGLSTNDYTDNDKNKLSSVEKGAQKNVVPNWNAQEGQSGCINNKPFGKFKVNGELFVVSTDPLIRNVHYIIPQEPSIIDLYPSKKIDYIRVYWSEFGGEPVFIDEIINIPDGVTSLKAIKYVNETPLGNFSLEFEKTESDIWVYLRAQDELFSVSAEEVLNTISVEAITCLPEEYIPDTIAREDESLRILRYISNPHIINMSGSPSERAIPKELYDAETDSFKMFGFSHDYPFVMIDHYGTVCPIYFDREEEQYIPRIWTVNGGASLIEISNGIVINIDLSK